MKNLNTKYKILALIPLFALMGCKRQEHKNVITGKIANDTERLFLLSDVQTGQKRVLQWNSKKAEYEYLNVGDTVSVFTGSRIMGNKLYEERLVLYDYEIELQCNEDSISERKKREELKLRTEMLKKHEIFEDLKQQITKTR